MSINESTANKELVVDILLFLDMRRGETTTDAVDRFTNLLGKRDFDWLDSCIDADEYHIEHLNKKMAIVDIRIYVKMDKEEPADHAVKKLTDFLAENHIEYLPSSLVSGEQFL